MYYARTKSIKGNTLCILMTRVGPANLVINFTWPKYTKLKHKQVYLS